MPSLSNPLQQAVFRGCVECIGVLVETPPYYSVDAWCGPEGLRPIHIAAREGHISALRYLSAAGACLHKSDANGATALHHAAIGGQLRATRWLLRHGAKIILDKRGRSPIQIAADNDHMEIVSLLAKHATSVTSSCLTLSSSTSHSSKSSPSTTTTIVARNHHPNNNNNSSSSHSKTTTTYGQQQGQENNHHNNNKGIRQLDVVSSNCGVSVEDIPSNKVSPTTCAADSSSSGNSSLATTSGSNSPSLSPSSATCSCSSSSESSEKSVVNSSADEETYSSKTSTAGSTSAQSVASFFLHPPKSSISPKSGNHRRQGSQSQSSAPFYLHLPLPNGDLNSGSDNNHHNQITHHKSSVRFAESDVEIHALETMAPVTPVSAADFMDKSQQESDQQKSKLRSGDQDSSSGSGSNSCGASTSSSPSPPPPQAKTVRIQSPDPGTEKLQIANSVRNGLLKNGNSRPPPPPPPMPKFEVMATDTFNPKSKDGNGNSPSPIKMITQEQPMPEEKPCYIYNGEENDYEDIDDVHDHINKNNNMGNVIPGNSGNGCELVKLNRTVSAPAGNSSTIKSDSSSAEKVGESDPKVLSPCPIPPKGIVPGVIHGLGGKVRVPFIPPNFPDPPKDALIKPSEYLKSIQKPQNKTKYGSTGPKYGCFGGNSSPAKPPSPRVEDAIKLLGNGEGGGTMPAVTEETNMEDEFEEINPERISGNQIEDGNRVKPKTCLGPRHENGHPEGGGVRCEELMKVTLRKTPMTRTNSAPPLGLGRVLPDIPTDQNSDQTRQSTEVNPTLSNKPLNVNTNIQNVQLATVSRAAVIQELAESSQLGGVREWKDELRRRQNEQEKAAEKEMAQYYSPLNFVAEIPSTDGTGVPIPPWKRQMLAKKAAEKARKEAEEQRKLEAEAKRTAAIPPWRRQLLQRRESDGKYAQ